MRTKQPTAKEYKARIEGLEAQASRYRQYMSAINSGRQPDATARFNEYTDERYTVELWLCMNAHGGLLVEKYKSGTQTEWVEVFNFEQFHKDMNSIPWGSPTYVMMRDAVNYLNEIRFQIHSGTAKGGLNQHSYKLDRAGYIKAGA